MSDWKYYNHAMIPIYAPHEEHDFGKTDFRKLWKENKKALLARWTTDFDCGYETNWWYVIKDEPFDLTNLKAKRRYEVNMGLKNFDVRPIDPTQYREELYEVQVAAFSAYPQKYRPTIDRTAFIKGVDGWSKCHLFGAFFKESGELVGYALLQEKDESFVNFSVQKTIPRFEKFAINAALVEGILNYYTDFLSGGGIICDGARSVNHETAFQDYLEKYFEFRKAYCRLHIEYRPKIRWIVKCLFPFRNLLKKYDGIGAVHKINGILKMEEILRQHPI